MRVKCKRLLVATIAIGMAMTTITYAKNVSMNLFYDGKNHAYNASEVKINIDGKELVPEDMPPVIIDGRTVLPMRLIAQALGCEVLWNEDTKQAFVMNDDYTVAFTLGSKKGIKNGTEFTMDVPAMIINDRTMLPVRALANALDINITWDDPNRTVNIGGGGNGTTTPTTPTTPTTQAAKVFRVSVPTAATATQEFSIEADSSMYSYDQVYVDDLKVVIDIRNATSGLSDKITATNSNIVTAIRSAQHDENGVPYTRVVLDLVGKKDYTVTQSADKKKITICFQQTVVDEISLTNRNGVDRLVVGADGTLGPQVSTLSNPQRIVVDFSNAQGKVENELSTKGLSYVTAARTGMFDVNTFRIVLEVGQLTEFEWKEEDGEFILEVKKSTLENLSYDVGSNVLTLENVKSIDIDDIEKNDRYTQGYYEITLPGNYESVYGYGTLKIGNTVIDNITVSTTNRETVIRFTQNRYNEYVVKETKSGYEISVKNPKDVYDKVLLLDAGHGGNDPGTSGNGLVEKELTLAVMLKVQKYLEDSDIKVYVTRDSDTRPDNNLRAQTANQIADLMVSIHMNSAGTNTTANGTETLYQVHSNDNSSKLTSLKAAEIMQSSLIQAFGTTNRGVKQRTDLLILNATTVPTILVEVCFLSNPGDALKISTSANQELVAKAMAEAIIAMMDDYRLR
ncbi:N-acetylmuramoyl-L-alanine amidase LytC precursor [Anaerotignum neopropionicum]|uniref:N-acetylmuramoyl-L-alanine amidase LytC n=1 Tax=Anaerotignum neopropionicum TaxID=36847 RepID=A0A136WJB4_9FIRM|nr:N-acetylmuramoyl-L-alanine amidase [Anaerotignum neopropionicum]KXL54533.1 N-acetylmuramoyl-L-alanine amidase LytC precursor [Anaerotignum neopropionicum]